MSSILRAGLNPQLAPAVKYPVPSILTISMNREQNMVYSANEHTTEARYPWTYSRQ